MCITPSDGHFEKLMEACYRTTYIGVFGVEYSVNALIDLLKFVPTKHFGIFQIVTDEFTQDLLVLTKIQVSISKCFVLQFTRCTN